MSISSTDQAISGVFEQQFLHIALDQQIRNCDRYELVPCFRQWLPVHQPILEAGSGSGRWIGWFRRQGWTAVGVDWSGTLCSRAAAELGGGFVAGDLRRLPFRDASFGSVVSLGAIEHTPEGPMQALMEFHRVLKPGGIAIVTVPFLSPVCRLKHCVRSVRWSCRRAAGVFMPGWRVAAKKYSVAGRPANPDWHPDLLPQDGAWRFFQYNFSLPQMLAFARQAGFQVERAFPDFMDEGVLHNFGRLAGTYDGSEGRVHFTPVGRLLRRILTMKAAGFMLCCILRA